jgi:hypothetical protein
MPLIYGTLERTDVLCDIIDMGLNTLRQLSLFDKKQYYAWKMKLAPCYFSDKTSWACLAPVE